MSDVDATGPLSWRDVYKAVGDAETRLLSAFDDMRKEVRGSVEDHEHRIRELESYADALPQSARTTIIAEIAAIKAKVDYFYNREEGLKMAGRWVNIAFHVAISLVSAAGTILMLKAAGAFN